MRIGICLLIVATICLQPVRGQDEALTGRAAVADAILWGRPMPDSSRTLDLPTAVQSALQQYRQRERSFKTGLKLSPGATDVERELFEIRLKIERTVFSLFSRRESARVAASYALETDILLDRERQEIPPLPEAAFVDRLLGELPYPWLAPYLNLVAGHRKLCDARMTEAAVGQLMRARDGGEAIVKLVAEHLLDTRRCS